MLMFYLGQYETITATSSQIPLHCGGQACPRCNKCFDFFAIDARKDRPIAIDSDLPSVIISKRNDATCCVDRVATAPGVCGGVARQNFRRLFFSHVCRCRNV